MGVQERNVSQELFSPASGQQSRIKISIPKKDIDIFLVKILYYTKVLK